MKIVRLIMTVALILNKRKAMDKTRTVSAHALRYVLNKRR